ncbi:MAG TPA: hypothetical protein VH107_15395 [Lacipirellulaceae bacterium]|jgi:hypothetical protein|nr:hypothetical protein [Lacipirellulaceae bacterium]
MPRARYEKPQKGNPHELVIRQHVVPVRSIERFAGPDGLVETQIAGLKRIVKRKPSDEIFVARRAWDERAERGYMKAIEDAFQELADKILSGEIEHVGDIHARTVNRFYALWYHRSRVEPADEIETQINGVTGEQFSKDQQEFYEKRHILFVRAGGKIATRHITAMQLQAKIDGYSEQIKDWRWGVIQTVRGEFVMPDVPSHGLMPIAPNAMLAVHHPNGTILKPNLIEINASFLAYTRNYFFARNIATALSGVTTKLIMKAVRKRDALIAKGEY